MFGKKTPSGGEKPLSAPPQGSPVEGGKARPGLFSAHDVDFRLGQPALFFNDAKLQTREYLLVKAQLSNALVGRVDFGSLEGLPDEIKKVRIRDACERLIAQEIRVPLTAAQITLLKEQAV